jgi:hypothetical protein
VVQALMAVQVDQVKNVDDDGIKQRLLMIMIQKQKKQLMMK